MCLTAGHIFKRPVAGLFRLGRNETVGEPGVGKGVTSTRQQAKRVSPFSSTHSKNRSTLLGSPHVAAADIRIETRLSFATSGLRWRMFTIAKVSALLLSSCAIVEVTGREPQNSSKRCDRDTNS